MICGPPFKWNRKCKIERKIACNFFLILMGSNLCESKHSMMRFFKPFLVIWNKKIIRSLLPFCKAINSFSELNSWDSNILYLYFVYHNWWPRTKQSEKHQPIKRFKHSFNEKWWTHLLVPQNIDRLFSVSSVYLSRSFEFFRQIESNEQVSVFVSDIYLKSVASLLFNFFLLLFLFLLWLPL